jgi:hypothetical protein
MDLSSSPSCRARRIFFKTSRETSRLISAAPDVGDDIERADEPFVIQRSGLPTVANRKRIKSD